MTDLILTLVPFAVALLEHADLCAHPVQTGMTEMSEKFKDKGAEVYLDEAAVSS